MAYTCSGCGAPGRIDKCKTCRARRLTCGFILSSAEDGKPPQRVGRFSTLAAAQAAAAQTGSLTWREPGIDYAGWSARRPRGSFLVLQESPADATPIVPLRVLRAARVRGGMSGM